MMNFFSTFFEYFTIIAACSFFGSRFTGKDFYQHELKKPSFAPPPFVFGIVWSILYLLQAIGVTIVHQIELGPNTLVPNSFTIFVFFAWLFVSTLWTPIFFAMKKLQLALIWIIICFILSVCTTFVFFQVSQISGMLMAPTCLWVGFASILNFYIVKLNPTYKKRD
mmetsp:Transcript_12153/g.18390  ORF Transcript_12153/g.18390 Transcript_12153/m.18390 type:complete len:166 (+) Transcript_12153:449-946(+)